MFCPLVCLMSTLLYICNSETFQECYPINDIYKIQKAVGLDYSRKYYCCHLLNKSHGKYNPLVNIMKNTFHYALSTKSREAKKEYLKCARM